MHVDASRDVLSGHLLSCSLCCTRHVFFFYFINFILFPPSSSSTRGGGGAARLFFLFSFSCSADHEWEWPPCKRVLSGWQPVRWIWETTTKSPTAIGSESLVYQVTRLCTVHCQESAGTGPVVLNVVPVTGAAFSGLSPWTNLCAPFLFSHSLLVISTVDLCYTVYWYIKESVHKPWKILRHSMRRGPQLHGPHVCLCDRVY